MSLSRFLALLFEDPQMREANERYDAAMARMSSAAKKAQEAKAHLEAVRREGNVCNQIIMDAKDAQIVSEKQATEMQERQRRQKTLEKSEAFASALASIPPVEIELQPPVFKPATRPVWSLLTYRNVKPSDKLDSLGSFITVDVETTGLEPGVAEIVQLSAITFRDFEPIHCFTTYLHPMKGINERAALINGITAEMVADAPEVAQIRNAFRAYAVNDFPLVGHNLEFDLKFLVTEGCLPMDASRHYYDTLQLSRFTWERGPYKLDILGENRLDIHRTDAHTSLSDAYLTGLLFKEICIRRTAGR